VAPGILARSAIIIAPTHIGSVPLEETEKSLAAGLYAGADQPESPAPKPGVNPLCSDFPNRNTRPAMKLRASIDSG
jgi:hypothetical protein